MSVDDDSSQKLERKPMNVLQWFPLILRLQMLFMSQNTVSCIKCHANKHTNDGVLRHPADGEAWKTFDERYSKFCF
jgi:hypothetical protein